MSLQIDENRRMLTCYLDDSGKDALNLATVLAGHVARTTGWRQFELEVEQWFTEYGIHLLHTSDLHGTKGEFADTHIWTVLHKQSFVARLCQVASRHVMMGVSMATQKGPYREAAKVSTRKTTVTAYSFTFNAILDWMLRDIRLGKAVHTEGLEFVLEEGNEDNAEVRRLFSDVRTSHHLQDVLLSIRFVTKDSCRAIQLADLLAFYSRRSVEAQLRQRKLDEPSRMMMKLLTEAIPHRAFAATGFHDEPPPGVRPSRWRH
jgi:hypothetical protein